MRLYNTLSRTIETLKPLHEPQVTVYTCGPTVYDYPHIGNWFTFIRYDLLIRTLKMSGYKPKWVMNITDVGHLTSDADEGEDKLAKGAAKEGKTAWQIADYYGQYFKNALARLNFSPIDNLPRATDTIPDQIAMIQQLVDAGYTYTIEGDGIYYDVSKFKNYGQLAGIEEPEGQSDIHRIKLNQNKRHQADFALWKFSPKDVKRDMEWNSPWGMGFPGWHIECSAMSRKFLGDRIDIHCGGIDHIPIHHTNEIAQSEAVTKKPLAQIWMHANHLLIDDQKIAKSLGNSITLEDIENHGLTLEALRLLVVESHYRTQSKFSWDTLQAAQNRLLNYHNFAVKRFQTTSPDNQTINLPDLLEPMADDLNSPIALQRLDDFISQTDSITLSQHQIEQVISMVDNLFGLNLNGTRDISNALKQLIQQREHARQSQEWQSADQIRQQLQQHNISVLDTKQGPIWQFVNR